MWKGVFYSLHLIVITFPSGKVFQVLFSRLTEEYWFDSSLFMMHRLKTQFMWKHDAENIKTFCCSCSLNIASDKPVHFYLGRKYLCYLQVKSKFLDVKRIIFVHLYSSQYAIWYIFLWLELCYVSCLLWYSHIIIIVC